MCNSPSAGGMAGRSSRNSRSTAIIRDPGETARGSGSPGRLSLPRRRSNATTASMNTILAVLIASVAAPPALSVDSAKVDRGEVRGGPILKQAFRITNRAAETVAIAGLDSGCGCLRRSVSKNELKPGESADVSMDVNTLTQPDGPQTWTLKLRIDRLRCRKQRPTNCSNCEWSRNSFAR